jgi:hypothetical protein
LKAGDAMVSLDFFSPVSPKNHVRQSLPFSYLTASVSTKAGAKTQVYSDIDEMLDWPERKHCIQFHGV